MLLFFRQARTTHRKKWASRHECEELEGVWLDLEEMRKWEQGAKTSKKGKTWQRGIVTHPLRESHWARSHFGVKRWESEKAKKLELPGRRIQ